MCDQCEIYKARIDELETAMSRTNTSFGRLLKNRAPKKKEKTTGTDWFDQFNRYQQADSNFIQAWNTFVEFRKQKGKAMTLIAGQRMLSKLAPFDLSIQTASLYTAVDKGWTNCYPESEGKSYGSFKQEKSGQFIGAQVEVNLEDL